ncbi:helicase-like protein [Trypanosoma cruzi]|nr:helicase-like protein [Trypanosoma cruzi]
MWPLPVWNNGSSGVVFDIRSAYNYWQQTEDQTKLSFDPLVDWISAFEAEQDFTDTCMKFGKNVLQAFRMHLMMASDPGIPLSEFVPDFTQPFMKMTPSRGPPSLSWDGEGRSVRCDVNGVKCTGTTHPRATYAAWPEEIARSADGRQKRQRGCPPLMGADDGSLHPFHRLRPFRTEVAPHRRHSIRYFELPDAIVEKGNGAYPPTTLDCGTTNYRHPRFGPAT